MSHTLCILTMALVTAQSPHQGDMLTPAKTAPAKTMPANTNGTAAGLPIMTHESLPPGTIIIEHGSMQPMPSHYMNAKPAPERVGLLPRLRRRISNWLHQVHKNHQPDCDCEPMPGLKSMPIHRPHRTLYRPMMKPNNSAPIIMIPPQRPQSQSQPKPSLKQTSHQARKPVMKASSRYPLNAKFAANVSHSNNYSCLNGQLFQVKGHQDVWVIRYANGTERDRFGGHFVLMTTADMKNCRHGDLVTVRGMLAGDPTVLHAAGYPMYRALDITLVERGD